MLNACISRTVSPMEILGLQGCCGGKSATTRIKRAAFHAAEVLRKHTGRCERLLPFLEQSQFNATAIITTAGVPTLTQGIRRQRRRRKTYLNKISPLKI
jgi:hypothetical protein